MNFVIIMPEYFDDQDDQEEVDVDSHTIPNLFPTRLLDSCLNQVQQMVFNTGVKVEAEARVHTQEEQ